MQYCDTYALKSTDLIRKDGLQKDLLSQNYTYNYRMMNQSNIFIDIQDYKNAQVFKTINITVRNMSNIIREIVLEIEYTICPTALLLESSHRYPIHEIHTHTHTHEIRERDTHDMRERDTRTHTHAPTHSLVNMYTCSEQIKEYCGHSS